MAIKVIATNRKAYHNYHIGEAVEAGLALTGSEIKSVRASRVTLGDAYVRPDKGELWLVNAHIARYESSGVWGHEPTRSRKLLLHRKQIAQLTGQMAAKGFTLVPTRLYLKDHRAKLEIALAKGKKQYDKREVIAGREADREMERAIKMERR